MHYIDKAKEQLTDLVGKVAGSVSHGGNSQTVTIGRPRTEVEQFWRDPDRLSQVLGGIAEVRSSAPSRYEWILRPGADDSVEWNTTLVEEDDGLRFVGTTGEGDRTRGGPQIQLTFRDAPRGLGTEVTIRARTPIPDILTGAAAFAALYRARALLQTGEMPTIERNPSARASAR
ncbi:hypothetical protein [Nocardia pneumoniae]|uniref:hypothetical protein n=1 Tax=Nocardia pneumoniae TaxID=228601 RepID=UPI0002FE88D4|nr:hypothetical protein [Nocardia pneumoniae]